MRYVGLLLLFACAPQEDEAPPPKTSHNAHRTTRSTPPAAPTNTYDRDECLAGSLDSCPPELRKVVEAKLQASEDARKINLCASGDDSACSPEEQERRKQQRARDAQIKAQQDAIAEQQRKDLARQETIEYQTCLHAASVQQLEAELAREKANPSGVVSLTELHRTGAMLQSEREYLTAAKAQFQKEKKRAFTLKDCEGNYP